MQYNGKQSFVIRSCVCITGYYENSTGQCAACDYTCGICNGTTANSCITCDPTRVLNGTTCECQSPMFDVGLPACASCLYSCLVCGAQYNICSSCPAGRTLINSSCLCDTGSYDSGVQTCSLCDLSCKTCSGSSSTNCLSCNSSLVLLLGNNSCIQNVCGDGYILQA